jgi:hypothetical protein
MASAEEILDYIRNLRDRFGHSGDDPLGFFSKELNEGAFAACCHILDHFDPKPEGTFATKPEETFATGKSGTSGCSTSSGYTYRNKNDG